MQKKGNTGNVILVSELNKYTIAEASDRHELNCFTIDRRLLTLLDYFHFYLVTTFRTYRLVNIKTLPFISGFHPNIKTYSIQFGFSYAIYQLLYTNARKMSTAILFRRKHVLNLIYDSN